VELHPESDMAHRNLALAYAEIHRGLLFGPPLGGALRWE
jgi:hypothetical protein